jgi:hypothetical protein
MSVLPIQATATHPVLDRWTGAPRWITSDHSNLHEGEAFTVSFVKDEIASEGVYYVALTTCPPADGYIHFKNVQFWTNSAKIDINLYKGGTTTTVTGGTEVVPSCRNDTDGVSACSSFVHGATVDLGNAVWREVNRFGSGGRVVAASGSGQVGIDIEWVFDANTTYVWKIENLDTSAKDIWFWAYWYEEEDPHASS